MLYEIIWYALGLLCTAAWTLFVVSYFLDDSSDIVELRTNATYQEITIETMTAQNTKEFNKLYKSIELLNGEITELKTEILILKNKPKI